MTAIAMPLPRTWVRARFAAVAQVVRQSPVAAAYAVVLLGTTILLRHVVPNPEDVLRWASTNLDNLATRPIRSMVASALFLPGESWLPYAAAIAITIVPLERRFGALRTAAIFLSGHVLATLVTEGGVAVGIHLGLLPASEAGQLDVGVSYGVWASAGAALLLLPRRWRLPVALGAALGVLIPLALDPDMTTIGHTLCFAIGLAWWPLLRRMAAGRPSLWDSSRPTTEVEPA